tara:strand:+ start:608 stop:1414 length:807 start_codon:yes stop_codon:yes gene_type:complete
VELILIDDVPNLGSLGDTVNVKSGYGRNFLIPKGMALLAKGKESKELRHRLEYIKKLREGKIELAKEQASKLKELNLEVVKKAGPEGKLFGSVSSRDLEGLLKANNFDYGRRSIILNTPIRKVGTHEFTIRIHSEVSQSLKIRVIGETENIKVDEKSDQENKEIENIDTDLTDAKDATKKEKDVKFESKTSASEANKDLKKNIDAKKVQDSKEKSEPKEVRELDNIQNSKEKDKTKVKQELQGNNEKKVNQEKKEKQEVELLKNSNQD